VIVATPIGSMPVVQAGAREAVFLPLAETAAGTIAAEALDDLLEAAATADALAIGPGLTRNGETAHLLRELVARCPSPMVIDADGLNAFEGDAEELRRRGAGAVLTPHDGEFARLMGRSVSEMADRVAASRALAAASDAVALLKGTRSVIAPHDGGIVRVNPTGTPSLATAGTGDVLTGVIGGLLARHVSPVDAATAGAFLHGIAGRHAAAELGEGVLAGDVADRIPVAREALP
jgi:ADP-dependent NAD(P)H-hydrate dehydratase / NAD(P)H-hydrate epimerase